MTGDGGVSHSRDGSWALVVRPLPGLTALALLVAGLGLWLMSEAEQARRGDGGMEQFALVAVAVVTVAALLRRTASAALLAAMLVGCFCVVVEFHHHYYHAPDLRLPWRPHVIASAGLVALVGLLCMLAAYRAVGASESVTLRSRLAAIAAYRGTEPGHLGRTLVAVAAGGTGMVLAAAGVRHSWNSRYPLPVAALVGLAVVLVLIGWLLLGPAPRRLVHPGRLGYLMPALMAAAGLVIAPFAVIRLWSYDRPWRLAPDGPVISPGGTWFDPEAAGLGVLAGCFLMLAAGGTLLALRGVARRGAAGAADGPAS